MEKSEMFKKAWKVARKGQRKFGGKVSEYFSKSLKQVWNEAKNTLGIENFETKGAEKIKMEKLAVEDIKGKVIIVPMTEDLHSKDYIKIGSNSGTFGWNWSAYKRTDDPCTWYIQGYRNFPQEIYVDSNGCGGSYVSAQTC